MQVKFDENGYWTGDYAEVGGLPGGVDVESLPDESDDMKKLCYKLVDGVWTYYDERYQSLVTSAESALSRINILAEIKELEKEIQKLNAQLTECATYRTLGLTEPYAVADVIASKTAKQNRMTELNESLS